MCRLPRAFWSSKGLPTYVCGSCSLAKSRRSGRFFLAHFRSRSRNLDLEKKSPNSNDNPEEMIVRMILWHRRLPHLMIGSTFQIDSVSGDRVDLEFVFGDSEVNKSTISPCTSFSGKATQPPSSIHLLFLPFSRPTSFAISTDQTKI